MNLKLNQEYFYRKCPACENLNAFSIPERTENRKVIFVCDWCYYEFYLNNSKGVDDIELL